MKKAILLILLLLFFGAPFNQAQTIHPNSFTEKYWGYYFTGGIHTYYNHPKDTLQLILCTNRTELYSRRDHYDEINGGVMFHKDGIAQVFHFAAGTRCGTPEQKKRTYTWELHSNVIVMVDTFGRKTYFKPRVIFNGKTILDAWN